MKYEWVFFFAPEKELSVCEESDDGGDTVVTHKHSSDPFFCDDSSSGDEGLDNSKNELVSFIITLILGGNWLIILKVFRSWYDRCLPTCKNPSN